MYKLRFAYINGSTPSQRRRRIINAYKQGEIDIIIASTILDEGFDAPLTEFLILAGGGKAEHRQVQRIGRGMRVADGKERLTVFDFLDTGKYLGKHSTQRAKAYRREKAYTVRELTRQELEDAWMAWMV